MHLGIIELYEKNHHSLIFNWIKIANINGWKITLYATKEVYDNVSDQIDGLKYRLVKVEGGSLNQLKSILEDYKIAQMDRLLFLSLAANVISFLLISFSKVTYGITIHNVNTWFMGNVIRKPAHLIKKIIRFKMKRGASFFVVNSLNQKNYIKKKVELSKPILVMPFSLRKGSHKICTTKDRKNLIITYPGSINVKRKHYDKFFRLAEENPNDKFLLLGSLGSEGLENERIFKQAKEISNIVVFDEYLPINVFNDYLRRSDLLFSDINLDYKVSDMSETYGITKDSGVSYLMAEFLLPALLNEGFKNIPHLKRGTISYSDYGDLKSKFKNLKDIKERFIIQEKMKDDLKKFDTASYAKQLKKLQKIN